MTLAQVAVGAKVRASVVNTWITQINTLTPALVVKTSDETITNTSTLQNDDVLSAAVSASATYLLTCHLIHNSGATPGFKLAVSMPSGTTWRQGIFFCGSSTVNFQFGVMTTAQITGITGAGTDSNAFFRAVIVVSTTPGTVQIQWAQNAANASNTIVRAGSNLNLDRIS